MQLPLQITARNLSLSDAQREAIEKKSEKLNQFHDSIMSCRVMVEVPHRHKHKGVQYNVRIDLTIPNGELVVKREADEDIYVSIRDAFDAMRRQLQNHVNSSRSDSRQKPPEPDDLITAESAA